jgi:hypothetical protein
VTPFANLADSRPGQIQRASNYTSGNPISKRFLRNFCGFFAALIELDLNVHARRQFQLHQGVNGLVCRVDNVHQALVRTDFVLVTRILVDVRRNQDRKTLLFSRAELSIKR